MDKNYKMICDICGLQMNALFKISERVWMQCPNCGIARVQIQRKKFIRSKLKSSDINIKPYKSKIYRREEYLINLFLNEHKIENILLYGIGWSPLFGMLKRKGLNVIGCDIDEHLIAFRNKEFGQELFFHPDDLPDHKFNIITACEVFEHFDEPIKYLGLLSSHIKDDGVICGCTNFLMRTVDIQNEHYWYLNSHLTAWNETAMNLAASKFNLKTRYCKNDIEGWENKFFFFLYRNNKIGDLIYNIPKILSLRECLKKENEYK